MCQQQWYFIVDVGICQKRLNLALFKSECSIFIFNGWTLEPLTHSNGFLPFFFFVSGVSAKAASSDDKEGNFAQFVIFT